MYKSYRNIGIKSEVPILKVLRIMIYFQLFLFVEISVNGLAAAHNGTHSLVYPNTMELER